MTPFFGLVHAEMDAQKKRHGKLVKSKEDSLQSEDGQTEGLGMFHEQLEPWGDNWKVLRVG